MYKRQHAGRRVAPGLARAQLPQKLQIPVVDKAHLRAAHQQIVFPLPQLLEVHPRVRSRDQKLARAQAAQRRYLHLAGFLQQGKRIAYPPGRNGVVRRAAQRLLRVRRTGRRHHQ